MEKAEVLFQDMCNIKWYSIVTLLGITFFGRWSFMDLF